GTMSELPMILRMRKYTTICLRAFIVYKDETFSFERDKILGILYKSLGSLLSTMHFFTVVWLRKCRYVVQNNSTGSLGFIANTTGCRVVSIFNYEEK
ncbi:MAG: hypothetical protein MJA30_09395, partial [Cytophagales bacterium]|nr:hypothetical protein [Cytophagales bacterium]